MSLLTGPFDGGGAWSAACPASIVLNPTAPPKVLLIANYEPDRQISMLCYANLLASELKGAGLKLETLRPVPILSRFHSGTSGIGKWLGYVDKFVIFPRLLQKRAGLARYSGEPLLVHICDHSNSPYVRHLAELPHVVTCHDLLAVRSALGEFPQNPVRWSGRHLQAAIVKGLRRARHVSCVSETTRADVLRVCDLEEGEVSVIPNALHHPFHPLPQSMAWERVQLLLSADHGLLIGSVRTQTGPPPFILHVGSNVWYKNRRGVVETYCELIRRMPTAPRLVMVGPEFTPELHKAAGSLPVSHRVVLLRNVTTAQLEALYSLAELLLFPSLEEGFGWPILEAFASGCRVVTTRRAPMTEIGGSAAVYADRDSPASFSKAVVQVLEESTLCKAARIRAGIVRAAKFSSEAMRERHLQLYAGLSASRSVKPSFAALPPLSVAGAR